MSKQLESEKNEAQIAVIKGGQRSISKKGLEASTAQIVPKGAVLYSCRAPIGYTAIADNSLSTSQGIKSIVPFEGVLSEYVYFCLIAFTDIIAKNASGASFKEISASDLGEIIIPLPPFDEQKRICNKITVIFKELNRINKNLS